MFWQLLLYCIVQALEEQSIHGFHVICNANFLMEATEFKDKEIFDKTVKDFLQILMRFCPLNIL